MTERSAMAMAPNTNTPEIQFAALQQRLQNVFPSASVVLVQQLYEGFRRRTNEFVLLVEITQAEETAPVVVKLGPTASK